MVHSDSAFPAHRLRTSPPAQASQIHSLSAPSIQLRGKISAAAVETQGERERVLLSA
jgi:hypothetical protein